MGDERRYQAGDVFQVVRGEQYAMALVYAEEVRSWGIVAALPTKEPGRALRYVFVRLSFDEIEYVGTPPLVPEFG